MKIVKRRAEHANFIAYRTSYKLTVKSIKFEYSN